MEHSYRADVGLGYQLAKVAITVVALRYTLLLKAIDGSAQLIEVVR